MNGFEAMAKAFKLVGPVMLIVGCVTPFLPETAILPIQIVSKILILVGLVLAMGSTIKGSPWSVMTFSQRFVATVAISGFFVAFADHFFLDSKLGFLMPPDPFIAAALFSRPFSAEDPDA